MGRRKRVASAGLGDLSPFLKVEERFDSLETQHKQILGALERSQETARFYQVHFQRADQIMTAAKQGYARTPAWKPDFLQDETYLRAIRLFAKRACFARWNTERLPIHVTQGAESIYMFVRREIKELISMGKWRRDWRPPGKRTIERRTQEAADIKYWPDSKEPPPLLGLGGGFYMPNPVYFQDEAKCELNKLLDDWQDDALRRKLKKLAVEGSSSPC